MGKEVKAGLDELDSWCSHATEEVYFSEDNFSNKAAWFHLLHLNAVRGVFLGWAQAYETSRSAPGLYSSTW